MRVGSSVIVDASIEPVWSIVSDPERMSGVTRWEFAGPARDGLGARYRIPLRVGAAEVGGLIELVEWSPPSEFAWTSVTGVDQRGRWRLREQSDGRTRVELRLLRERAAARRAAL